MSVHCYRKNKWRIYLFAGVVKQIGIYFRIEPPFFDQESKFDFDISLWIIKLQITFFK